ncbi:MAG TPA: ribonuclease D, partial [Nocardioides sp.]|nr:ribonuclease D [Nocardioides sp.]
MRPDTADAPPDPPDSRDARDPVAESTPEEPPPAPVPLLELRDGLPPLTDTPPALVESCRALAAADGPVAIDAERASGYRYSPRAYLIQLRREGAGTFLIDPIAFDSVAPLQDALAGSEWILHAATQDLPCLTELGLVPAKLFDTELAGRLLGYPRVGLATLAEVLLGQRMKKEHSAADWSTRPLPQPWLEYAALDVEVLIELREVLARELHEAGKDEWARQEFEA